MLDSLQLVSKKVHWVRGIDHPRQDYTFDCYLGESRMKCFRLQIENFVLEELDFRHIDSDRA